MFGGDRLMSGPACPTETEARSDLANQMSENETAYPVSFDGTSVAQANLLPPLKWAGGKRWLIPTLRALWRPHSQRRLVEPFVGGMAVALALQPQQALLNDINPHLINFYLWLQRGLTVGLQMANEGELYYRHRQRFNDLIHRGDDNTQEAAELFYYLNRTGYNGLCRFNRQGGYNVPFGRYRTISYVHDFQRYTPILSKWEFTCTDFAQIPASPDDWIYADPPYDVEFTSYSAGGFSWGDQVRLAEWLAAHPGPVVASNQATARIQGLYGGLGFQLRLVDGPRHISCTGDRAPAQEILATRGI
jgi:DNA adenine methylase